MHQKLCILFITCKVYVDTDFCIYSHNCVLLVMSCGIPINGTCGHMRNIQGLSKRLE